MSDLDEARVLLARWAAGKVSDPDVWAGQGPRLLAGLVAEVERLESSTLKLERAVAAMQGRLLQHALMSVVTADQETPE